MELDIWWLLLIPAFFGLGWFAARVDMRTVLKQAKAVPNEYFKSLDALVEDKSDLAAISLTEVARQESKSSELQMTLGKLYRKRGENDRAIRLHQSMLESSDVHADMKERLRLELAHDFHKAGLIDRAEEMLLQIKDGSSVYHSAQLLLLDLYQQDRDWGRAIEISQSLRSDVHSFTHEVAQYYCELAQAAIHRSQFDQARAYVEKALQTNRRCVRANILLGDIELAQENYAAAIQTLCAVEKQNVEYLSMIADRLFEAYERQGSAMEGLNLIRGYAKTFPQLELLDFLYDKTAQYLGVEAALDLAREVVHRRPTLAGAYRLIESQMLTLPAEERADAELVRSEVHRFAQRLTVHRCRRCNFKSRAFFWQCPACAEWESLTPNRNEV